MKFFRSKYNELLPIKANYPFAAFGLVTVLLAITLSIFGGAVLDDLFDCQNNPTTVPYMQGLSQLLFILGPALLAALFVPMRRKELFRFNPIPSKVFLLYGLLGLVSVQFFTIGFDSLQDYIMPQDLKFFWNNMKDTIDSAYGNIIYGNEYYDYIRSLIVAAAIPAFVEELMFRGLLQKSFEQKVRPTAAIFASSIIFSAVHFNPISLAPLLLISVLLGVSAYYSGSIFTSMIIHFINNAFSVFIFLADKSQLREEMGLTVPVPAALFLAVSGLFLTILTMNYMIKESKIRGLGL